MSDLTVARTILDQLGGQRFIAMTGAKNFVGSDTALSFKVGKNAKRVTNVRVSLELDDTYTVHFIRVAGKGYKDLARVSDVYAEDLCRVFEENTGLYTKL